MSINICIVSYYGPKETIGFAEQAMKMHGKIDNVYDFPLFQYMHDINSKIINYVDKMIEFIKVNNITHLLWWFINIPTDEFIKIKNLTKIKYLFFNWDEPFNWEHCDIKNKASYFDAVFVTCKETLVDYIDHGCEHAYCLYPGFSEKNNFIIKEIDITDYNK